MKRNEETGTQIVVPHLAESLVSAAVGKWLKAAGDYIREYDVLCELITDKVSVQMPSPVEGTLVQILVPEGEQADVGATLCLIREPVTTGRAAKEGGSGLPDVKQAVDQGSGNAGNYGDWISPVVKRMASELKIELSKIRGTGLGGRITRKDVLAYAENRPAPAPVAVNRDRSAGSSLGQAGDTAGSPHETSLAVSPVRRLIATRMKESVNDIPHAWMMVEADVTPLVLLRNCLKDRFLSCEGVKLTYAPFVLKAVVTALKEFPMLNASWAADTITIHKDIHVCIAVGSEESVVTPVLRHADRKTIAGLAIELDDLAKRARAGTLTLADLQGGTFTFNNTGAFGSVLSYPILNAPQAAILTFESIVRRPAVIHDDCIAIRALANVCLSLDHRLLDGAVCGRFLQRVKQNLEHVDPGMAIY